MSKYWDPAIQYYVDDGKCHCPCHHNSRIIHCFPCCEPSKKQKKDDAFTKEEWDALENFMNSGDHEG